MPVALITSTKTGDPGTLCHCQNEGASNWAMSSLHALHDPLNSSLVLAHFLTKAL